jgi:hypothetical protein
MSKIEKNVYNEQKINEYRIKLGQLRSSNNVCISAV